jgi:aconitate hydratase
MSREFEFTRAAIDTPKGRAYYYDLSPEKLGYELDSLPYSIRILLENALRFAGRIPGAADAVRLLMEWPHSIGQDLPFMPSRVLLQDYTGVPLIVDLAAMRTAGKRRGVDPKMINSKVPVDLVIDHSIQVDAWGNQASIVFNLEKEFERNSERYSLLKWAQTSFDRLRVFPPGKGICHQFNLEYLANVVATDQLDGKLVAYPDTLVGTDSHTTMINGLGVLGWGVGGIEAEAVMLGEPYSFTIPRVVGVKLTGELPEGATPTDLVLTVTESLRKENVVDAFVEYFGDSYSELSVPDRATIGNMSPEYGATVGFSPVDDNTIKYLLGTGRDPEYVNFVKKYCQLQGLYMDRGSHPEYSTILEINLSDIEPSIAGPRNPDERISLKSSSRSVLNLLEGYGKKFTRPSTVHSSNQLSDGSIVIAAITSCTNTSNPTVMLGAGLLAEKAVKLGLKTKPYVKSSMAPGSNVVKDYLERTELLPSLERLGFNIVGYGCTTCIGNSGPLIAEVEKEIRERDLYAVAVLSGNRNFEGRIHPLARGSFLMSPPLVVAYALAGRMDIDFYKEPIGIANDGSKVYLKDIWPRMSDIKDLENDALSPDLYRERYAHAQEGDGKWSSLEASADKVFEWDKNSTYIREPLWFESSRVEDHDIKNARVLALFGDKVTTDHISPAGTIAIDSPTAIYLKQNNVPPTLFSSYGARRGNHEVMVRGGFSNIRLKNLMAKGKEGGWTIHNPSGELMTIYDASMRYQTEKVPLIILAGKQYGAGSSRDWAAKVTLMLGVKAVIAESYERIHRSNLIAMGVLPLVFADGKNATSLGLDGSETYDISGIDKIRAIKSILTVRAQSATKNVKFTVIARLDNEMEIEYYRYGGILPYVFRKFTQK